MVGHSEVAVRESVKRDPLLGWFVSVGCLCGGAV